jgi:cell division transport system permease protein
MRSLAFLFREFLRGLSTNRFLHFTYGAQVTISLLVLGIFFVLLVGAVVLWGKLGQSMEIHLFLDDSVSAQQNLQLQDTLEAIPHVTQVRHRSKDEALAIFSERNSSIPLEDLLEDNPLPASFILNVDRPGNIESVVQQCDGLPGVVNIRYGSQVLERYLKVLLILGIVCLVTMTLLIVFTYSSINNIIALSIYARRTEIRIMQLVGATWWFIRWPFLFEGVFFGAAGGLAALIVIWLLMAMMGEALRLSDLTELMPGLGVTVGQLLLGLSCLLLGLGAAVGFFGSLKTVNAFLAREADAQLDAVKVRQMTR